MRLKQIKLTGFKSFVDATTVPFPQQMTAIVGPNGCGKSNIIDAVRWVLGESSAKNLRGDAMTDVIFNGSSARKPIFQASVELFFDNSEGRLTGGFADRNEISVRRLVTRDSTNSYFLNGTKCRRRDITDIFLGTGLGPRSYAIIEQGTISRLIESKPQELRIFIEEAAGISKYKERRRETETRIRATRENLARLSDVRIELSQQIEKLHRQAEAAKRFRELKKQERKLKAELAVLKWQQFNEKCQQYQAKVSVAQTELEKLIAEQRHQDLTILTAREQAEDSAGKLDSLQHKKFQLAGETSRLEQTVKNNKQSHQQLLNDISRLTNSLVYGNENLIAEQQQLTEINQTLELLQPELIALEQQLSDAHKTMADLHNQQEQWQLQWDSFNQTHAKQAAQLSVIQTKLSHQTQLMARTQHRISDIEKSIADIDLMSSDDELKLTEQEIFTVTDLNRELNKGKVQLDNDVEFKTQQYNQVHANVKDLQTELKNAQIQVNLLANYAEQNQKWQQNQQQWLHRLTDEQSINLMASLTVEEGWESAVEQVLSTWLTSNKIDKIPTLNQLIDAPSVLNLVVQSETGKNISVVNDTLLSKVHGNHPFSHILSKVFLAEDDASAIAKVEQLTVEQSVITAQGLWLSNFWLKRGLIDDNAGVLLRHKQLIKLNQHIETIQVELPLKENEQDKLANQLESLKAKSAQLAKQLTEYNETLLQLTLTKNQIEHKKATQEQQLTRHTAELLSQKELLEEELLLNEALLFEQDEIQFSSTQDSEQLEQLTNEKYQLKLKNDEQKKLINQLTEQRQQKAVASSANQERKSALLDKLSLTKTQLQQIEEQKETLNFKLQDLLFPLEEDEFELQTKLTELSSLNDEILAINQASASVNEKIKTFEQSQHKLLSNIDIQRNLISEYHVDAEGFRVRANNALEQLQELKQNVQSVLAEMPTDAKENVWQYQLEQTSKSINRLGPINLAAIDEYESQLARKNYLDAQNEDLESALTTLENAILKIDKESRAKFKATFEQVNADLQTLFPKVFGGGSAYLALTDDDFLETGVTIMARPPGKKNSTIHLLSGGEKALTALSLVFAIFRLNPAPFCMLDEVDAPLDDANVERFCNLVREMSQTVQFIYISHNKIAMEMASQLTGVTMQEPGVSRMVAVDIDEAIAMADV